MRKVILVIVGFMLASVIAWAGSGFTSWTALIGSISDNDLYGITDVSNTSQSPEGSSVGATHAQLTTYLQTALATTFEPLKGTDDNFVTDVEKAALHASGSDDQDLSGLVETTGNETVAGVKTFSSSPIVPTPTTDYQAATKLYADGLVSSGLTSAPTVSGQVIMSNGVGTYAWGTYAALATAMGMPVAGTDFYTTLAVDTLLLSYVQTTGMAFNLKGDHSNLLFNDGVNYNTLFQPIDTELTLWADIAPTAKQDASKIIVGSTAMPTIEVLANTCSASASTDTATGATTAGSVGGSYAGDVTGITGFGPLATDGLYVYGWATIDTVNFKMCNGTATAITPGSAVTINWTVTQP